MPKLNKFQIPDNMWLDGSIELMAADAASGEGTTPSRQFNMIANTGGIMTLPGFKYPVVVDLAGATFSRSSTPVVADHNTTARIGHTTSQIIVPHGKTAEFNGEVVQGPIIVAAGPVSSDSVHAKNFVEDASKGYPFQSSIGAAVLEATFVEEGRSVVVNGETFRGPIIVASRVRIRELTVTVLGADDRTSTTLAAQHSDSTIGVEDMGFNEWLKARATQLTALGFDVSNLTAEQKTQLQAMYELETPTPAPSPTPAPAPPVPSTEQAIQAMRDAQAADTLRTSTINNLMAQYSPDIDLSAEHETPASLRAQYQNFPQKGTMATLQAEAIRCGMQPEHFELICLRAERPAAAGPGIHVRNHDLGSLNAQAIECSLAREFGVVNRGEVTVGGQPISNTLYAGYSNSYRLGTTYGLEQWYPEQVLEASHDRRYRNISLRQMIDTSIQAAGLHYTGNRRDREYIRTFLSAEKTLRAASGGFSTLAVTNILENVANKQLLQSYQAQETVWQFFCAIRSLNDFKIHSMYALDGLGRYRRLTPAGQIQHGTLGDRKYTLQIATYAEMLALNREDIINDDLNAFQAIPTVLGKDAAVAIESAFFVMLLSNPGSFFAGGNGNLQTGAGSDLTLAGLALAEQTYMNQVDPKGDPILVSPSRLLVGTNDYVYARQLYDETKLIATDFANSASTLGPESNPHKGKYLPYKSPYLNNTAVLNHETGEAISGQGTDAWYMFCDPNTLAAFFAGFLNGSQVPVIESSEVDFDRLGLQWRSYNDFGFGSGNTKGAVKMAGA